jgi:murein DD-endopeptidase MepM/ murein hydrolase activator NlpD
VIVAPDRIVAGWDASMPRSETKYRSHESHGFPPHPRLQRTHSAAARLSDAADYTIVHGGRQLRLKPAAVWTVIGTFAVMAAWSIATASYFTFHDDVLTRLMARQAQMQYGYEDRIADLRAQLDRLSSRHLLDQEQYEQKLDTVLRRQAKLESHAAALSSLAEAAPTGSIVPAGHKEASRAMPLKPSLIGDAEPVPLPPARKQDASIERSLSRVEASLDRHEESQAAKLHAIEASYEGKATHMRDVLADLGLRGVRVATRREAGVGGPFVPVRPPTHAGEFERHLYRAKIARLEADRLDQTLATIPVRKPIAGELDLSSGFGVRIDPFGHGAAMHTGLDFRGDSGDPVRATANGKVTRAGWSGGYGRMVEIDHGNGLSTRYGHLSAISVRVGETVNIGQVIGRIGSTGRSTGPHLHYETRVHGEAVNPQKFLRAGAKLGLS